MIAFDISMKYKLYMLGINYLNILFDNNKIDFFEYGILCDYYYKERQI